VVSLILLGLLRMRCEVCGKPIRGEPLYRVIEGARMMVCHECARFGREWRPPPPRPRRRRRVDLLEAVERLQPIEGYGELIRRARERLNLTQEELGMRLGEKASVIRKLERGELVPDRRLAEKLRRVLRIEVLAPEAPTPTVVGLVKPSEVTIGDLIKVRKKEEDE
jgi:putative transcription factor